MTEPQPRRTVPSPRRRWVRLVVSVSAFAVVICAGLIAGYSWYLNSKLTNNVQHADLMPTPAPGDPPAPTRAETAKNSLNFLMLGSDSRGNGDQGRSDVIVLAHISDDRTSVHLVHFPRDLYVDIPGHGKNKINAAFAFGGAPLLAQTLENVIQVPIDHVAKVDFNGFKAMTDAVGGVDVMVAEASPGYPQGIMHMSGAQGLTFVRDRHDLSQGDISRGQRQLAFIEAVMLKGLSKDTLLNPAKLASFLEAATTNLTVDRSFDVGAMRSLAIEMRSIRGGDIHFLTAPWTGIGTAAGGASIVTMSEPQMKVLSEALKNDTMATYTDTVSPTHGFSR